MANNSINLVNLDFDTLKEQLKTYLRSQSRFTDYDFDGSNMSVLLDILSYNSHLNAFYLNMVMSEMFLDSAQLRNSVISIAKSLNYTPRSTKSSKAVLNVSFPQSGLSTFTIPKFTRFSAKNSRGTFQFVTTETFVLSPAGGFFSKVDLPLFEGTVVQQSFVVNAEIENQRFILPDTTIDTDSLEVSILEDGNPTPFVYRKATNLSGLTSESPIFFVQATDDTRYEVVFGDGVFGSRPKNGSVVTVVYRNSVGLDGNDCNSFNLLDNLGQINGFGSAINPSITVVTQSFGGAAAESLEEIRFRAPKAFQVQDRAITIFDYETLLTQEFQNIKSVNVYGGEEVIEAPRFGSVYIVPVTFTGELLSQEEKFNIETFLKRRMNIGVTPIVINPDFLFVDVSTIVKYNPNSTTLTARDIETLVKNTIQEYNETQIRQFNVELNLSVLQSEINQASSSIIGNKTELTLRKNFNPTIGMMSFPVIEFRNAIVPGTVQSSSFSSFGRIYRYIDYNPQSDTIEVVIENNRTKIQNTTDILYLADITDPSTVTYSVAGNVDYTTGLVTMNSIVVNDLLQSRGIEVSAKPLHPDIISKMNDIISIDSAVGIIIEVVKS